MSSTRHKQSVTKQPHWRQREGVLHCRVQRHSRTSNTSDRNARFRNAETCAKGGGGAAIIVFFLQATWTIQHLKIEIYKTQN